MKKFIVISLMLIVGLSIFSACKEEDYPDEIRVSNFPPYPPAPSFPAPALVIKTPNDPDNSSNFLVTWTIVPNAVSYNLYLKDLYGHVYYSKTIDKSEKKYSTDYPTSKKIYISIPISEILPYFTSGITNTTSCGISAVSSSGITSSITWSSY